MCVFVCLPVCYIFSAISFIYRLFFILEIISCNYFIQSLFSTSSDYVMLRSTIVLSETLPNMSIRITILDDSIHEEREIFIFSASHNASFVSSTLNATGIIIPDNDSKLNFMITLPQNYIYMSLYSCCIKFMWF